MDNPYILVVDDNHINRLFFLSALEKLNCQVITASSGNESVELCHQNKFDLIFMDIRMNGINGVEAAHLIKSNSVNKTTPMVAISAERFDTTLYDDFDCSLLKPVNQNHLIHLLKDFNLIRPAFNNNKALEFAHHDQDIVQHLRNLFLQQLKPQAKLIESYFQQAQNNELSELLHKLLGSAKVCAAEEVYHAVLSFKESVESGNELTNEHHLKLQQCIKKTLMGHN